MFSLVLEISINFFSNLSIVPFSDVFHYITNLFPQWTDSCPDAISQRYLYAFKFSCLFT